MYINILHIGGRNGENIECPVLCPTWRRSPSTVVEFEFEFSQRAARHRFRFEHVSAREGGGYSWRSVSTVTGDAGRGRAPLSLCRFVTFLLFLCGTPPPPSRIEVTRFIVGPARTCTRAYVRHFHCAALRVRLGLPHPRSRRGRDNGKSVERLNEARAKNRQIEEGIGEWPNFF